MPARSYPLVSVKCSEFSAGIDMFLAETICQFDLFLHDFPECQREDLVVRPVRVFAANHFIADQLRRWRPDVIEGWCPSTLAGKTTRGRINIWTFGMAHKGQLASFQALKALLEATPEAEDYTICQSLAVHEGAAWDETFCAADLAMRTLFGEHLRFLGFLADDGLASELHAAQAVALFYDPAVRANHTTAWAALEAGTVLLTNLDAHSPPELRHNVSVFDINQLTEWPDPALCREVRWAGRQAAEAYGWERLVGLLA